MERRNAYLIGGRVHPIVPYARTAYAQGWAASGGPLTDRVIAGSIAAIEMAIEHADDPDVLEATLHIGQMEGMWAKIFDRRTALYETQVAKVGKLWKSFVADLDVAQVVTAIRNQTVQPQEAVSSSTVDTAVTLILTLLSSFATGVKWWNLRNQIELGLIAGEAEGYADALALVADQLGYSVFDFAAAMADAEGLVDPEEIDAAVDEWLANLLDIVSRDSARRLVAMTGDSATFDEMIAAAREGLSGSRALTIAVGNYIHSAITKGIMALYRQYGVGNIWWITAGDQTVCPVCDQLEAESPYTLMECPLPPEHVNCRCSLYTEDSLPGDLVSPYVD